LTRLAFLVPKGDIPTIVTDDVFVANDTPVEISGQVF